MSIVRKQHISLVALSPRPSSPLIFDDLQHVNVEGEGLGNLVICSDIR